MLNLNVSLSSKLSCFLTLPLSSLQFQRTYGTVTPFRMSKILFLTPGSVIVDYTLTYDPNSAPAASSLEQRFNDTVTSVTSELKEGVSTGLYLEVNGVKAGSVQGMEFMFYFSLKWLKDVQNMLSRQCYFRMKEI